MKLNRRLCRTGSALASKNGQFTDILGLKVWCQAAASIASPGSAFHAGARPRRHSFRCRGARRSLTSLSLPLMLPLFILVSTLTAVAARGCSSLQPSHPPSNNFQFNWTSTCPLPTNVWSWGLSLSCCDVFPRTWGQNKRADLVGEHGVDIDWATVPIGKAAIVYVPSWDIGSFLARFATLPRSHRISVVSGGEDVGGADRSAALRQ